MARIYVPHSAELDFRKILYTPIRKSTLNQNHDLVLPHEVSDKPFNSQEVLKTVDFVIAEASYPSTGMGIELGWADAQKIPIGIIYQKGTKVSSGLQVITAVSAEYHDETDIITALINVISELSKIQKR